MSSNFPSQDRDFTKLVVREEGVKSRIALVVYRGVKDKVHYAEMHNLSRRDVK